MVSRVGVKPTAFGFVDRCSIQLSYRDMVPSVRFELTLAMILSQRPLPIGLRGHYNKLSGALFYLIKHRRSVTTLFSGAR